MDADEMESARKLLEMGSVPGGLGPYAFEAIEIPEPEGLSVLAMAIPAVGDKWGGRLREVAIDSTCKCLEGVQGAFLVLIRTPSFSRNQPRGIRSIYPPWRGLWVGHTIRVSLREIYRVRRTSFQAESVGALPSTFP